MPVPTVRYSADSIDRTYDRLLELSRLIVKSGFSVVVDATFLMRRQRQKWMELADNTGVPLHILDIRCPEAVLRARIANRLAQATDPSEADLSVLERQLREAQPLQGAESERAVAISTAQEIDADGLVTRVLSL